jgi:[pyruvate, water dikinase]-phosphate phosphotransferase / [pyruvate, water dikinase] kinase
VKSGVEEPARRTQPAIYVVSGGVGSSGDQLVQTVLAQFPENRVNLDIVGSVRSVEQIEEVVNQARETGALVVHTLVDAHLREFLTARSHQEGVVAIDLVGSLLAWLAETLGREPLADPGRYRKLHREYFERVAAIEYTMAHDDGKDPAGWHSAEIVLVGVSRTGKTPLSLYLSVLGWKVANVPIVPGVPESPELSRLDRRRVVGLTIEAGQLLIHRKQRQARLGAPGFSAYVDPAAVYEEIQTAEQRFHEGGFAIVDVTDKTIETSADEIIRLINRHIK